MHHLILEMHIISQSNKLMINKIIIYVRNDLILGIGLIIEGTLNT
jgi:hypothetical protein